MLTDDVLLEVFDFYVIEDFHLHDKQRVEGWQMLVQAYRRWRITPGRICLSSFATSVLSIFNDEPPRVGGIIGPLEHNFPIRSWVEPHHVCDEFDLFDVLFPGLPELLLSAAYLVYLDLSGIPGPGYILSEVTTTSLSALTVLESLRLDFRYARPRPALEADVCLRLR
ncbi:hypothetical protein BGY98DRAFT_1095200 [Russula aff. rugulosa BPL654]|nr:hypothetical protein BGY98DRAFT_1095200 [Russula aff. rugulosa BPL654]